MTPARPEPRSLKRVMAGVVPATIFAQLCSFGASIALAHVLGATDETDAYFLGLTAPLATYGILLAGVRLGAIPALTKFKLDEPSSFSRVSSEIVSSTAVVAAAVSIVATVITYVALPGVISGSDHLVHAARVTTLELAPLGVLGAVMGVLGAVLAAGGSFVPAAAVLAFDPLARVALVLTVGDQWGATSLVAGNLIGNALAIAALVYVCARHGIRIRPVLRSHTPVIREVMKLSGPLVIGQSVLQLNPLIDRSMAAGIHPGSVTQLELALRLFAFPLTVITATLIGPLTAEWTARKVSAGWTALRDSVGQATLMVIAVTPPIAIAGLLFEEQAIGFIYRGGAYSSVAIHHTAQAFGMFLVGFPAQLLVVVCSTLFVVQNDAVFPMKVALANVFLNVGLNFALREPLGVAGIALSTSLTLTILAALYALVAQRRWHVFAFSALRAPLARAAISALAIFLVGDAVLSLADFGTDRASELAAVALVTALAVGIHAVALLAGRGRLTTLRALAPSRGRVHA